MTTKSWEFRKKMKGPKTFEDLECPVVLKIIILVILKLRLQQTIYSNYLRDFEQKKGGKLCSLRQPLRLVAI